MAAKPRVTLVRRLRAAPAKVYAALTEPEALMRWWRPDAGPVLSAEADVRPGGRFRIVFRTLDGEEHCGRGEYREVVPNQRLVFTWGWESVPERESMVSMVLRPIAKGTELTLTHTQFLDEAERDRHRDGWNGAFDHLEAFLRSSNVMHRR